MPDQTETSCECGGVSATLCLPLDACIEIGGAGGVNGERIWESDWFTGASSSGHDFTHSLHLDSPWLCKPTIVGKVITATGGWEVGDLLFTEGANYNGDTAGQEIGWTISLARDTCHVSFGNSPSFIVLQKPSGHVRSARSNFVYKLVISY